MNKFFLKLFNKNKYQELKYQLQQSQNLKHYNDEIKSKLEKISNSINKKKELTFLHSGHLGDVINALPIIREVSINSKCKLYLEINRMMPSGMSYDGHPSGKYYMSENSVKKLIPLIKNQQYISEVEVYKNENIDIDLNLFRSLPINFNIDSVRWYFHLVGMHPNLKESYININPHTEIKNKIVIMRSLRRQNKMISYNFLNEYERPLFIGLKKEYEDLKQELKNLEFYDCKDFIELASIIKGCRVFIGNLSFGYALAEAIKVKRMLESGPDFPLVYPNGENAYDFYFQSHFENLFKKLYNN